MKKAFKSSNATKKNRALHETMRLLILSNEFQQDINEIRKAIGLSQEIAPKNEQAPGDFLDNWSSTYQQLKNRTDRYFEQTEIKKDIKLIKKEFNNKKTTWEEYDKKLKTIEERAPGNALKKGIHDILKKFNLPPSFDSSIEEYIVFKSYNSVPTNYKIITQFNGDGSKELLVVIRGLMTKQEKKMAMEEATDHFKEIYPRFTKRNNARRSISQDIKIIETFRNGKMLKIKTSKSMGEHIWEDNEETIESISRMGKKLATRFRQAKRRIMKYFEKVFGRKLV